MSDLSGWHTFDIGGTFGTPIPPQPQIEMGINGDGRPFFNQTFTVTEQTNPPKLNPNYYRKDKIPEVPKLWSIEYNMYEPEKAKLIWTDLISYADRMRHNHRRCRMWRKADYQRRAKRWE